MIPGQTTEDEVSQLLTDHGILDTCRRRVAEEEEDVSGRKTLLGLLCRGSLSFTFDAQGQRLMLLGFAPRGATTVREALAAHGDPDFVSVWVEGSADQPLAGMDMFYEDLDAVVHLRMADGITYTLRRSTTITMIVYASEDSFEAMLSSIGTDRLQGWHGYSEYEPSIDYRPR
jgi:hypothetical protein